MRRTTPSLLGARDRIANFGYAVAAANCSTASNLILRTGARPADLPQGVHTNPYIWSYARRAGMRTVFIRGSARPLAHGMSFRERRLIDEVVRTEGGTRRARDLRAVDLIGNRLVRGEPQFVIVVKSGISREASSRAKRLDDAYGKAVAFNLDPFFGKLLADVPLDDVVVLYTSDHGQDLLDDGSWINCSTSDASPLEALVPMLAITRHPVWRGRFAAAVPRNRNRTSHYNLFATLLALFGYDPAQVADRYEPGLLDAIEAEYGFTTGLVSPSPRTVLGPRGRLPVQRIPPAAFEDGGM